MKAILKKNKVITNSAVKEQSSVQGDVLITMDNGETLNEISSLDDIVVGSRLYVGVGIYNFIVTSKVMEIIEKTDKMIKFNTETSEYELTLK